MSGPIINSNEEIDFIVNNCNNSECTREHITNILNSYNKKAHKDGNPENHYNRIAKETGLSLEIIELVFDYQLEFLYEKGLVEDL